MQFTKNFAFTAPGSRMGQAFKAGINYKKVDAVAAAFAAANGYTSDPAALKALEVAGGKTAFLKADKAARKTAAAKSAARLARKQAADNTSVSKTSTADIASAVSGATEPLNEQIAELTKERDALQAAADVILEAHNTSPDVTDEQKCETLADLAKLVST